MCTVHPWTPEYFSKCFECDVVEYLTREERKKGRKLSHRMRTYRQRKKRKATASRPGSEHAWRKPLY